ncbi:hypothetical protein AMTRI_Chr12g272320 [Amborella trichopoda]
MKDVFTLNLLLKEAIAHGCHHKAFQLFNQFQSSGGRPNTYTFPLLAKSLISISALPCAPSLHCLALKQGLSSDISVATSFVALYGKLGFVKSALRVFDEREERDFVLFTAMISVYVENGAFDEGLRLFGSLNKEGLRPGAITLVSALMACMNMSENLWGKGVHGFGLKMGFGHDCFFGACLVSFYCKIECFRGAHNVFDGVYHRDVALCNAMISGFAQRGMDLEAFGCFREMRENSFRVNANTITGLLKVCANSGANWLSEMVQLVHSVCIKVGLDHEIMVATSILDGYGKRGLLGCSSLIFAQMPVRSIVSWTALMGAYVHNGHGHHALKLLHQMQIEGVKPDMAALVCALSACGHLGSLKHGSCIHGYIIRNFCEIGHVGMTTIINMYAKCGSLASSYACFDGMACKNLHAWSSMIRGYGMHGHAIEAMHLFDEMLMNGVKPDGVIFLSVLSACSHGGLVEEGKHYFHVMTRDHGIEPNEKHYACMVDLLSRAGRLDEAHSLLMTVPMQKSMAMTKSMGASAYGALLGACQTYNALGLGESVAKHLINNRLEDEGAHILVSNIYASRG